MTILQKIESKGYKVTNNIGYRYGGQVIVSVTGKKDNKTFTETSLTKLYNTIKNH